MVGFLLSGSVTIFWKIVVSGTVFKICFIGFTGTDEWTYQVFSNVSLAMFKILHLKACRANKGIYTQAIEKIFYRHVNKRS